MKKILALLSFLGFASAVQAAQLQSPEFLNTTIDNVLKLGALPNSALGTDAAGNVIGLIAYNASQFGIIGDGTTENAPNLQATLQALANQGGARLTLPCGRYIVTTAGMAVSIPNNVKLSVYGAGSDCTVLAWRGTTTGLMANYQGIGSSIDFAGLTFTTNTSGTSHGLTTTNSNGPGGNSNRIASPTTLSDVIFRGDDTYSSAVDYWTTGFTDVGVSNLSFFGGACDGSGGSLGGCYSLNGYAAGTVYATSIHFFGTKFNNCATGIFYGDYVQQVTLTGTNTEFCSTGVGTSSSTASALVQLSVDGARFNTSVCGICINDSTFSQLMVSNTAFNESAGLGIRLQGNKSIVHGNVFIGPATTGIIGVNIVGGLPQGNIVESNTFAALDTGVQVSTGAGATHATISHNLFANNTSDYSIAAGTTATLIDDNVPRVLGTLPVCDARIPYSRMLISDGNSTTYLGNAAGLGSLAAQVLCDASAVWVMD